MFWCLIFTCRLIICVICPRLWVRGKSIEDLLPPSSLVIFSPLCPLRISKSPRWNQIKEHDSSVLFPFSKTLTYFSMECSIFFGSSNTTWDGFMVPLDFFPENKSSRMRCSASALPLQEWNNIWHGCLCRSFSATKITENNIHVLPALLLPALNQKSTWWLQ